MGIGLFEPEHGKQGQKGPFWSITSICNSEDLKVKINVPIILPTENYYHLYYLM